MAEWSAKKRRRRLRINTMDLGGAGRRARRRATLLEKRTRGGQTP